MKLNWIEKILVWLEDKHDATHNLFAAWFWLTLCLICAVLTFPVLFSIWFVHKRKKHDR